MYGIANKLSGKVTGAVEDTLKWVNTNIDKIVAGTGEFISGTVKGSKQAADKIAEGWKEGKDYKQLAKENPEDFLTVYKDLKKNIPHLEMYDCKDLLEMAQIIKSSKFFLGNQSIGFAISETLKCPRLLEASPETPNVQPEGKDAFAFFFQPHFEKYFKFLYDKY